MLNPTRCGGTCLSTLLGGSREQAMITKQDSSKILGGPPGMGTRKEADLEAEVYRLTLEMQRLEIFNEELERELEEREDPDCLEDCDNGESPDGVSPAGIMLHEEERHRDTLHSSREEKVSHDSGHMSSVASGPKLRLQRTGTKTNLNIEQEIEPDVVPEVALTPKTSRWLSTNSTSVKERIMSSLAGNVNSVVIKGSVLGKSRPVQAATYLVALGFVLFVLIATSSELGVVHHDELAEDAESAPHRRLGGDVSPLMKNIAFTLTTAGLMTFICHFFQQPIVLGYILGGVLVGPIGLNIVKSHVEIAELSSLGLVFLLFMIGLEMDIHQVQNMDLKTLVTGVLQYPICFGILYGFVLILWSANFEFGPGTHATLYCAMSAGLSSTMIVGRLLDQKGDSDSPSGRLTMGVLFCQDVWAIIVLAFQPDFALSPDPLVVFKEICIKILMLIIALAYAKFVMPAVLQAASKSVELMLVMSLAWCFFICSASILPFVGISMELAALTSGVALATFPYSAEFNAKIKYIRDFFITLFFAGLGMQIPVPTGDVILKAILLALASCATRWIGVFLVIRLMGGSNRLASLATINLAQVSEFALVFCVVGLRFGHITEETMVIILWSFALLNILSVYMVNYNYQIFRINHRILVAILGSKITAMIEGTGSETEECEQEEGSRDIVLLGFHRIAMLLLTEFEMKNPELLKKVHVIDYDQDTVAKIRKRGIKCTFVNDISLFQTLKDARDADMCEARMIISTIPDSMLRGTSNMEILSVAKDVWPRAHYIVTADNPAQAHDLYASGADYVLRMAKLCAERLYILLSEYEKAHIGEAGSQLEQIFNHYKSKDKTGGTINNFKFIGS